MVGAAVCCHALHSRTKSGAPPQDLVQLDAGVVVRGVEGGGVLLLGEHKMAPRIDDVAVTLFKHALIKCVYAGF